MPRVKRGTIHNKTRKKILQKTKGFKWGRKNLIKAAKTAAVKAGAYAYRDRRNKKRDQRRRWQIKLNAAAREHGLSYSRLIDKLTKAKITINRKVLSELAEKHPKIFTEIIKKIK